jgi:hypothetical protein
VQQERSMAHPNTDSIETVCGCSIVRSSGPRGGMSIETMQTVARRHESRRPSSTRTSSARQNVDQDDADCRQKAWQSPVVMDTNLARLHGAVMVVGTRESLDALWNAPETIARMDAFAKSLPGHLSEAARRWAVSGRQGCSSQAMFYRFTSVDLSGQAAEGAYPLDVADLLRCLHLVDQVPEFAPMVQDMANVSPAWSRLAEHWDDLTALVEAECPEWRTNPTQLARTREALDSVTQSSRRQPSAFGV